jgi:hypothetical protein
VRLELTIAINDVRTFEFGRYGGRKPNPAIELTIDPELIPPLDQPFTR